MMTTIDDNDWWKRGRWLCCNNDINDANEDDKVENDADADADADLISIWSLTAHHLKLN